MIGKCQAQLRTERNPNSFPAFTKNTKICFHMDFYPKLECWQSSSEYPNAPVNPESTTKTPRLSTVMRTGNLWLQALGLCNIPFNTVLVGSGAVIPEILPFLKTLLDTHSCSFYMVLLICKNLLCLFSHWLFTFGTPATFSGSQGRYFPILVWWL